MSRSFLNFSALFLIAFAADAAGQERTEESFIPNYAVGGSYFTWNADADFESGIGAFTIYRDGKPLAQIPEKPLGRFGRPLFQAMSYHDTPEAPLPEMEYLDTSVKPGGKYTYRVIAINSVGLKSEPSQPALAP